MRYKMTKKEIYIEYLKSQAEYQKGVIKTLHDFLCQVTGEANLEYPPLFEIPPEIKT